MKGNSIKKLIDDNYTTKHMDAYNLDLYIKKCYSLGIIDGYMEEELFKDLIKKDEGLVSYEKGYIKGESLRKKDTERQIRENKKYFIERLAFFDALNNFTSNISDNTLEMYKDYYEGEYSFKTGKYIPKSKK